MPYLGEREETFFTSCFRKKQTKKEKIQQQWLFESAQRSVLEKVDLADLNWRTVYRLSSQR